MKLTTTELSLFRAKMGMQDWLIDTVIDEANIPQDFTGDIVVAFFLTPKVYLRTKERYPQAKVIYAANEKYKDFFGYAVPDEDRIYVQDEKELQYIMQCLTNPIAISNPPYGAVGGPVIATIKSTNPTAKQAILMPASCYKTAKVLWTDGKEYPLYQFIDTVKVVGGDGFGAVISENNCIVTLRNAPDVTKTYQDLVLLTVDSRYKEAYLWNIQHTIGLDMHQDNYKGISNFNIDTDFIESARCFSLKSGAGFGKGGFGYEWNVTKNVQKDIPKMLGVINFKSAAAKANFTTAWYSAGKKGVGLLSKLILGVNVVAASAEYYYAIPQINWATINITQKVLWDAGEYDNAILAEMGLKWDGDTIVKVG